MKIRALVLFLLATLPLSILGQPSEPHFNKVTDILYREDAAESSYAHQQCRLDVYYPKGKKRFSTIVWFHGGGLKGGTRKTGTKFAERFTAEGYGVVLVSYRLSPRVKCPVYIEDAAASIAWTFKNIGRYGGDPKRIFISGHSAGGYLTAMVGLDPHYLAKHKISTKQIAGLIPIAGQMVTHTTVRAEKGIPKNQPVIDEFAPAYHVRKDAPPCLCFAGDKDLPARAEENIYFAAALKATGHSRVECLIIKGRNHGSIAGKFSEKDDEVTAHMLKFMEDLCR